MDLAIGQVSMLPDCAAKSIVLNIERSLYNRDSTAFCEIVLSIVANPSTRGLKRLICPSRVSGTIYRKATKITIDFDIARDRGAPESKASY